MLDQGIRRLRDLRREDGLRIGTVERRPAAQHLVRHGTQSIDVRTMVDVWIGGRLLGGHVGRSAQRHTHGRQRLPPGRIADCLGDAEVRDQRVLAREQHVVGFDVAMHHALLVRVGQCVSHVAEDAHGLADGQFTFAY